MTSSLNLNELGDVLNDNHHPDHPSKSESIFDIVTESRQSVVNGQTFRNIVEKNDAFVFKTANVFLTVLVLSSLFDVLYSYTRTGVVAFIVNLCMLHFYNLNSNMFDDFDTSNVFDSLRYNLLNLSSFVLLKAKEGGTWLFDKLFSKNTQFVLKIIFKIAKSNVISKYEHYRNTLFNPKLLNETNNEYVYYVPMYLNGVNYKIPIVVDKYKTKNLPLMVLNKDEEDITGKMNEFLGPNSDFFGMILKPKHFGERSLNFMMDDGSELTMEEHDLMVL